MKQMDSISDELLVKFILNETTHFEQIQIQQWLEERSRNEKYFEDFKRLWESAGSLTLVKSIDVNDSWRKFQQRIDNSRIIEPKVKKLKWKQIAAITIGFIFLASLLFTILTPAKISTIAYFSSDNIKVDTLPDASIITLNKNSSLSYLSTFNNSSRNVSLKGEAFFKITPNKDKPFVINVNDLTVKVVGTSFNIKSLNGNTEVIVESGIVQVTRKNKSLLLKPNEKTVIHDSDTAIHKIIDNEKLYNYYKTNQFVCNNTPLSKLVNIINEAYNVNIQIEGSDLNDMPITTTFNNESLTHILQIIQFTFNIKLIDNGKSLILKKGERS